MHGLLRIAVCSITINKAQLPAKALKSYSGMSLKISKKTEAAVNVGAQPLFKTCVLLTLLSRSQQKRGFTRLLWQKKAEHLFCFRYQ